MYNLSKIDLEHCEGCMSRTVPVCSLAIALLGTGLYAQDIRGAITGVVTDPTQAVVPSATVTVRNTATGVISKAETNSAGVYNVPSIILGPYDMTLELGAVGESVTVSGEATLLQAERSEGATEVTKTMLNTLPMQLTGAIR